jgi:hypothetical protein
MLKEDINMPAEKICEQLDKIGLSGNAIAHRYRSALRTTEAAASVCSKGIGGAPQGLRGCEHHVIVVGATIRHRDRSFTGRFRTYKTGRNYS